MFGPSQVPTADEPSGGRVLKCWPSSRSQNSEGHLEGKDAQRPPSHAIRSQGSTPGFCSVLLPRPIPDRVDSRQGFPSRRRLPRSSWGSLAEPTAPARFRRASLKKCIHASKALGGSFICCPKRNAGSPLPSFVAGLTLKCKCTPSCKKKGRKVFFPPLPVCAPDFSLCLVFILPLCVCRVY